MASDTLRILIVDDSALFRLLLRDVLSSLPNCRIVGNASDGIEAVKQIEKLKPDLVTLDVEMPNLNGIETLRAIKQRGLSTRVLMLSRHTDSGATVTTDALLEGAFDFILKPAGNPAENRRLLEQSLREKLAGLITEDHATPVDTNPPPHTKAPERLSAIIIGCSTGGPQALRTVIPALSPKLSVPVIIAQHMPAGYTHRLAQRLNELSPIEVTEAMENDELVAPAVFVIPGGKQLKLSTERRKTTLHLTDDPPEHGCRPAVDYVLRSAVPAFGGQILVAILTGMGRDGTSGCQIARDAGARIIAQHPDDCTVYGMPKGIIENGLADEVVPLAGVAEAMNNAAKRQNQT